jgi:hypothetical protein
MMLSLAAIWIFAIFLKGFAAPRLALWLPSFFDHSKLEFVLDAKNLSEKRKKEIHNLLEKTITIGSRYEMDQAKNALISLMAVEKVSLARTKKNRIDVRILARIPYVKISEIDHAWATKEGVVFINHDVDQFDVNDLPALSGAVQPRTGEEVEKEAEIPISSTEMHAVSQAINLLRLMKSSDHGNDSTLAPETSNDAESLKTESLKTENQTSLGTDDQKTSDDKKSLNSALPGLRDAYAKMAKITEVRWNAYRGISFTTSDSTEIVIGQGPFEDKIKTLYKLFADGRSKDFSHIELDYRGKIFAKKRG